VIVDGDVQSLPAGELRATAPAPVATKGDLLIAGHALDVEMEEIAGAGMLIAHDRGQGMQIAPAAETSAAQNATDGGGTESSASCNVIGGTMLTAKFNY
jgi:hypothetical protein